MLYVSEAALRCSILVCSKAVVRDMFLACFAGSPFIPQCYLCCGRVIAPSKAFVLASSLSTELLRISSRMASACHTVDFHEEVAHFEFPGLRGVVGVDQASWLGHLDLQHGLLSSRSRPSLSSGFYSFIAIVGPLPCFCWYVCLSTTFSKGFFTVASTPLGVNFCVSTERLKPSPVTGRRNSASLICWTGFVFLFQMFPNAQATQDLKKHHHG